MKEEFITQGGIETFPEFPAQTILPESGGENSAGFLWVRPDGEIGIRKCGGCFLHGYRI